MKIDVDDSLYEEYLQLLKRKWRRYRDMAAKGDPRLMDWLHSDIERDIEGFIWSELRRCCAPGHETDTLTGCKTRHCLEMDISRALRGNGENDNTVFRNKYLCVDLDDFKSWQDYNGLGAGDLVLKHVADQLRQSYPGLNIYRIGGDEFVVELDEHPYVPLQLSFDVNPHHSIVEVTVQRNCRSDYVRQAIMFHLIQGIVESTEQGTSIVFKYPDSVIA